VLPGGPFAGGLVKGLPVGRRDAAGACRSCTAAFGLIADFDLTNFGTSGFARGLLVFTGGLAAGRGGMLDAAAGLSDTFPPDRLLKAVRCCPSEAGCAGRFNSALCFLIFCAGLSGGPGSTTGPTPADPSSSILILLIISCAFPSCCTFPAAGRAVLTRNFAESDFAVRAESAAAGRADWAPVDLLDRGVLQLMLSGLSVTEWSLLRTLRTDEGLEALRCCVGIGGLGLVEEAEGILLCCLA